MTNLIIYIVGVVLVIVKLIIFEKRKREPISLGDLLGGVVISLWSWIAIAFYVGVHALNLLDKVVIFKFENKENKK